MKTKYFLVFLALLLSQISNYAIAQKCLLFDYDADGNRISRNVTNNCLEMKDYLEVEENEIVADVSVYPNPTNGRFKIIMPESIIDGYSCCFIYDINGVLIIEKTMAAETDVDIGNMPNGVYLLKIINGEETFSKIIVKH
jgi:hypothetical protein